MSKPTQPTGAAAKPVPQARKLANSVWSKGPPTISQPASQTASPLQSPNPNKDAKLASVDSATASAPPSARTSQAGQPRKTVADAAPVAASKAVNIPTPPANVAAAAAATPAKNPALNFGTIDNPDSAISSSPAAKPTTGAHLGEGEKVKSFGSVAAGAAAAQPASVNTPAPAAAAEKPAPTAAKPKFDPHKMFQKPSASAATPVAAPVNVVSPALSAAAPVSPAPVAPVALASPAPAPHPNPYANLQVQQPGQPGIPQARGYNAQGQPVVHSQPFSPSGGPQNGLPGRVPHRSPNQNHAQLPGSSFSPNPAPFRPQGRPQQPMNRNGPGYPPQMQGAYPGMPGFNPYGQHAFGGYGGEFQPQQGYPYAQHYQGMPGGVGAPGQPGAPPIGSPNMGRPQLHNTSSSFSSSTSIPHAAGPPSVSPMSPQPAPGTPMQTHRTPGVFVPGGVFSPASQPFTPATPVQTAKKTAIKISRPDGTALDLSSEAKKVKSGPAAATIAAAATTAASASPKPAVATPVVVRIESPVQKQERERELEAERKRKEEDERAERERKERKAREEKEKEDKERADKEQKEAEDKERAEKEKKDAEAAEADKKAQEDKKAEEEKKASDAAEASKAEAEAEATKVEATKASEEGKAAESAPKPFAIPSLPSKPSSEVLEKATLAAPDALGGKSATPSPRASPAISHATLPPKPESAEGADAATDMQRKGAPAALNLEAPAPATASSLALKTAKVIEDIRAITYPTGTAAPIPALNESATNGKFRYDREFLLQFLNICKEKVPTEATLDILGIDKDQAISNGGFARGGSQRGNQRSSQPGGPRGQMGGMGSFQKTGGASMGQFGAMGSFSRPPQTSEERLAASRANIGSAFGAARNSQGGMSRTTSQAGPMGGSMQGGMRNDSNRTRSVRGKQRGGEGRGPMQPMLDQNVAPLEASENRWTPAVQNRRPGQLDENSPEFIERKVKGLLNKLTAEKFDSISNQILEWANKSVNEKDGQTLRLVIKLIFEKAKDEQFWSKMYASLCQKLWRDISPEVKDEQMMAADGKPLSGGLLFRKYLLNRCQEDFEKGWKQKADASAAAKEKAADDQKKKAEHDAAVEAGGQVEEFKFSDEYYAEAAAKRQGLGLVKFVGELFKLEILSTKVIHSCIVKLLSNVVDPDEEDVESLCQLLTTVGAKLEAQPKMAEQVQLYIQRMKDLSRSEHLTSRIKFMVEDVIELQRTHWKVRNTKGEGGPMTIEQVHAQARAEAEASRVAVSHVNMSRGGDSASRGGSRRGQERGGFGGPGGDAWQNVSAKLPARPADMSSFGKIAASGAGPTSFGPNSVFGKKKGGKASGETTPPPISRTPSSNMFSALEGHDGTGEPASPPTDGAPQIRKRLQLQPRTVSSTDVDKADASEEANAGSELAPVEESTDKEMTEEEIDRKIKNDVEELWGAKDQGGTRNPSDIAEYFETLPESARTKLAIKLIDDVFRLNKRDDAQVVVKGFKLAMEKNFFTPAQAKDALTPSIEQLDDTAVDVPKAYEYAAELIVATKLPQSDVDALGDAIETYGEYKVTPKDKLLAAVEKAGSSA